MYVKKRHKTFEKWKKEKEIEVSCFKVLRGRGKCENIFKDVCM